MKFEDYLNKHPEDFMLVGRVCKKDATSFNSGMREKEERETAYDRRERERKDEEIPNMCRELIYCEDRLGTIFHFNWIINFIIVPRVTLTVSSQIQSDSVLKPLYSLFARRPSLIMVRHSLICSEVITRGGASLIVWSCVGLANKPRSLKDRQISLTNQESTKRSLPS
jgi:hypothetical protein